MREPRIDARRGLMSDQSIVRANATRHRLRRGGYCAATIVAAMLAVSVPSRAATEVKPYDDKIMRLSEILGAVHYLRELCGANEGQYWRDRMRELSDAEGSSALRRAKLARAFNQGYRSYSRTYNTCSPSAQSAITRFLAEGTQISEGLIKTVP
jgi:uncharacterized protein (TIGR02301 family)